CATCGYCSSQVPTASTDRYAPARSASASSASAIDTGPWPWKVSATRGWSRGPCTTCGPSGLPGCLVAVAGGLAAGDDAVAADSGSLAPGGPAVWCVSVLVLVLVQPARPAPVAAAPASSKNSRRSIGTCRTIPSFGRLYGSARPGPGERDPGGRA